MNNCLEYSQKQWKLGKQNIPLKKTIQGKNNSQNFHRKESNVSKKKKVNTKYEL